MVALAHVLHRDAVARLAGSAILSRGERYYQEGRVQSLTVNGAALSGVVVGTETYEARIVVKGDTLAYACSCPFSGESELFCKHLVALSLEWLSRGGVNQTDGALQQLSVRLSALEAPLLVTLLLELARRSPEALAFLRSRV
jgi:uncharacterized Zn finger protein